MLGKGNIMNTQLMNVLRNSYYNSEYYRELYNNNCLELDDLMKDETFDKIPILTRENLMKNFERILCSDYKYLKRKQLFSIQTSGSTGCFVNVLWEPREYMSSNLALWRKRKQWYGITPSHNKCSFVSGTIVGSTITGNNHSLIWRKNNVLELSVLNMSDQILMDFYKEICDFKPHWIYTSQSALLIFMDFCKRNNFYNFESLKYIELATEQVLPSTYRYIKEFFKVPTAVMYGSKEVNGIALSCPHGNLLHVLEDNVYVEQTKDNKILVTSLKNTVFPIIRYELGDLVNIVEKACDCGEGNIIIDSIKGRERELNYVTKNGITTSSIVNCIYVVNARLDYPFIQYKMLETENRIIIQLVLKSNFKNWKTSIEKEMKTCFQNFGLPDAMISIEFYDKPLNLNGKTGKLRLLEEIDYA